MHIDNLLHGVFVGKADVMEKAAPQERIGQFFFVIAGDENNRSVFGDNGFAGFVAIKFHAIEFTQQIIGKFNISFVDFIYQQHHLFISFKGAPHGAF